MKSFIPLRTDSAAGNLEFYFADTRQDYAGLYIDANAAIADATLNTANEAAQFLFRLPRAFLYARSPTLSLHLPARGGTFLKHFLSIYYSIVLE